MNATHEEWRPVVGYEGSYEVSDQGRVHSLLTDRILRPGIAKQGGYHIVSLWGGERGARFQKSQHVHWLVLAAFVGRRPAGDTHARHLNDVPTDNRLENLAWGTRSENYRDAVRNGRHVNAAKTHCKRGHEFTSENTRYDAHGRTCRECHNENNRRYHRSSYGPKSCGCGNGRCRDCRAARKDNAQ